LGRLKVVFPGVFFHCKDNGNHDHPYSHVVTMLGTRFLQRRIKPGSVVLDVYGNPNGCDGFNKSQSHAENPKSMKALVNRCGPTDFIREINKWGPYFDADEEVERYHRGSLQWLVESGEIKRYNVLQMIHTLYYVDMQQLTDALHAPCENGKRVAYALIHNHVGTKGSINDGEQTYTKRFINGQWLVRQVNVATRSTYTHPCLQQLLFQQRKVWLPKERLDVRGDGTVKSHEPEDKKRGVAWELHKINDETWVVELVPYLDEVLDGVTDYDQMWEDDEAMSVDDYMSTPSTTDVATDTTADPHEVIVPTLEGKFLQLEVPCKELFNKLRMSAMGKVRDAKLLEELITMAKHLCDPSSMFGDKIGIRCPPDKIYDVAVAAFMADIAKENRFQESLAGMRPVLLRHARAKKMGPNYKEFTTGDLMDILRNGLFVSAAINKTIRNKDIVGEGIEQAQRLLT